MKDRGLWEMRPEQVLQHGYDGTMKELKGLRSEGKFLEVWQKNQALLNRLQRGTTDYTLALGVRKALKELCKQCGISDPDTRIEWLSRHGKKG